MSTDLVLPQALDEVGAEFVTVALSQRFPGTRVSSVRFSQVTQGTGTRARVHLDYAADVASDLPATMWLKASYNDITSRMQEWQTLETEGRFYSLSDSIEVRCPVAYASLFEPSGQSFILLEDLTLAGAEFNHPLRPLAFDQARAMLSEMARFHASLWDSPRLDGDLSEFATAISGGLGSYYYNELTKLLPRAVRGFRSHLLAGRLIDDELMAEAWQSLQAGNAASIHCLNHFDLHIGNTYFDSTGRPGILDWTCTRRGVWAHDVNYFLISALDIKNRRRWDKDLLRGYLDDLASYGAPAPDFDVAWTEYIRQSLFGLMMWLFTTPDMQNEETCVACIARFAAAMHDYDTLGAITGR